MAHIRLDDKRLELSMAGPRVGTGSAVLLPAALGSAAARVVWECPATGGNRAVLSTEAPMLATLEVVTEGVSKAPVHRLRAQLAHIGHGEHINVVAADDSDSGSRAGIHRREPDWFVGGRAPTNGTNLAGERDPADRAPNSDTAVRFRGAKVIFRSEPEIVDADGATDLLVIQDC